ncbi:MAG: prepilin-type N-terminal cleavage/methylation domain-containing protein [Armatimonadota bacterium]|nr:prepilin-type N-terminal cleavage/methylation domain-containing protein [Armatimonadota bacterium]MDR7484989.1 prepilin-type N-terminal cleavage/methylation domain-containing protein [Armatimonadota bacterium]MDR7533710.1 prepilin-type N-terminal cleavage/methylation domain-containing protein [Armatimonadota bacterium]MDR7535503.1 prepilin-type N-terminal cleavage/methylation domain-containing protein [Armatimonadota bacterium]
MTPRKPDGGFTLIEVVIAMLLLGIVALGSSGVVRSLGLLGRSQISSDRHERPARLRTLAMEYIQAELEYLQNRSYYALRDASACNPPGAPTPIAAARRVPSSYLDASEPRLPASFAAADIIITTDPTITAPASPPLDCRPRVMSVTVYLAPGDLPAVPGGAGGTPFIRGATARSWR